MMTKAQASQLLYYWDTMVMLLDPRHNNARDQKLYSNLYTTWVQLGEAHLGIRLDSPRITAMGEK